MMMEKITTKQLILFLLANNITPKIKQRFLVHSASCLLQSISDPLSLAMGNAVDVVFSDFTKAFDRVPHNRLLFKLEHVDIRGTILFCIRAFLKR